MMDIVRRDMDGLADLFERAARPHAVQRCSCGGRWWLRYHDYHSGYKLFECVKCGKKREEGV
jgi:hypothetical protein